MPSRCDKSKACDVCNTPSFSAREQWQWPGYPEQRDCMQFPPVRNTKPSSKVFALKPGVGQNIASHAWPAFTNSAYPLSVLQIHSAYRFSSPVHTQNEVSHNNESDFYFSGYDEASFTPAVFTVCRKKSINRKPP